MIDELTVFGRNGAGRGDTGPDDKGRADEKESESENEDEARGTE